MPADWVESLRGKVVVVTGATRPFLGHSRADVERLLRRAGARVADKVSKNTDLLVRGESPHWKFGDFGVDEEDVARLQRDGVPVVIVTLDGLQALLEGRPAQTVSPHAAKPKRQFGAPYREPAAPPGGGPTKVFERDPVAVERGLQAHVDTQSRLRDAVVAAGLVPRSSFSPDCDYDVAWKSGRAVFVAEVKSLTSQNERAQVRLGLGQVLDYADFLRSRSWEVSPVLALESKPASTRWQRICAEAGVSLVWPATFGSLFD